MLKNITSNQIFALYSLQIFTTVIAFYTGMLIGGVNIPPLSRF